MTMYILLYVLVGILCTTLCASKATIRSRTAPNEAAMRGQGLTSDLNNMIQYDLERRENGHDIILRPLGKQRLLPYFKNIIPDMNVCKWKPRISVDTGSSDIWIDASIWCDCFPEYDPDEFICKEGVSELSKKRWDKIEYADRSCFQGPRINSKLRFSQTVISNIDYVAALDIYDPQRDKTFPVTGMVGLGFRANQQATLAGEYLTLPQKFVENHNTKSTAYSIWFEDTERGPNLQAKIIFGGFARNKYNENELTRFEILPGKDVRIPVDAIKVGSEDTLPNCELDLNMIVDTGSYSIWVPIEVFNAIVTKIGNEVGRHHNYERVFAIFDGCDKEMYEGRTVDFHLGQVTIQVPMSDIVRPWTSEEKEVYRKKGLPKGLRITDSQCITYGISAYVAEAPHLIDNAFDGERPDPLDMRPILGIQFLRHAFVLYDLLAGFVSLAPVRNHGDAEQLYAFDDRKFLDGIPRRIRTEVPEKEICGIAGLARKLD